MFERYPHIGSTAFDRATGGFVYYANAWSKGIPVSAPARHAYIYGPRSDWFDAILGKEAIVARRPYWRTLKRMVIATFTGCDPAEREK